MRNKLFDSKITFLFLLSIIGKCYLNAQSNDLQISLNSGLFYFSGASSTSFSSINFNQSSEDGYTNNPFGNKAGVSWGFSSDISRITRSNWKWGLDLGFEIHRSKLDIREVWTHDEWNNETLVATGYSHFNLQFINLWTHLGHRFRLKEWSIDVEAGMDLAYCLRSTEKGIIKPLKTSIYKIFSHEVIQILPKLWIPA